MRTILGDYLVLILWSAASRFIGERFFGFDTLVKGVYWN